MNAYATFLNSKAQSGQDAGFVPYWLPDFLFDFQRSLCEWAIRKGRAAILADCGMGKSPMQLVWASNVARHTNGRVLILTVLGDSAQMVDEGRKFGVDVHRSRDGKFPGNARIILTNYERLHYFTATDFDGVVCNESSILKNFDGKTKAEVTEFMRTRPYRLLCTATAAPNDYVELGTSAEALGEMGFSDMLTRFFKQTTAKDRLGWGRTKFHIKGHAEHGFWRWVCSWARAVRKPSDLGFDDGPFILPPLTTNEYIVKPKTKRPGVLFDMPAMTLEDEREERRRTLPERCERVAELVNHKRAAVVWCHLNDEGDTLTDLIPGSVQVSGADSDEAKEEAFQAFAAGQIRVLVSKPVIAGFGLNWQHCSHQTFFPSHSFEQWYQAIRRCWRFGQKNPVVVDVVTSEGEAGVLGNLRSKAEAAEKMFDNLVRLMHDHQSIDRTSYGDEPTTLPEWLRV